MIFFMLGSLEMSDLFCMFAKNKNMRLIIDCGSTKADWVLLDNSKVLKRFKTEGFNPNYISEDSILNIILFLRYSFMVQVVETQTTAIR